MAAVLKDQGLILGKMKRGEPLTQEEQMRLMSRSADFSKGSPAVVDFSESAADKTQDVGVMESAPNKEKGLGSSVANIGSGIIGAAGYGFPGMGTATATLGSLADGMSPGQTVTNAAMGMGGDIVGLMGPVGQLGMAAFGMFSSENPAAAFGSFVGGMVGSTLGPWGGLVGSAAGGYAGESYSDGLIGDAMDSRSYEGYRDSLEEGMSREQAAGYAAQKAHFDGLVEATRRDSQSSPDPGKFNLGGNVTDSTGNAASVGVTEGSSFGGASVSNPGSTESGIKEAPSLGDAAAGMFGGGGPESSGGIGGGNAGGVRGGGSEGNSGYW